VALADMHAGHRLGLLNPETVLLREADDGSVEEWTPELTETQRRLWHIYQENIEQVKALAGRDEVVVIHDGDATHGTTYREGLIPGTTQADQREIAVQNLRPLAELRSVRKVRLVTGTAVHVPNSAEMRIAHKLAALTGRDVQAVHHTRLTVDGVVFDVAHHGPFPGSRDWLRGNVARYYLRSCMYEDRRQGLEPARVYLRGHYHTRVHEVLDEAWRGQRWQSDLYILPSFCGLTAYARKVTRSEPVLVNGLVAFEIVDGVLVRAHEMLDWLDLRTEEVL